MVRKSVQCLLYHVNNEESHTQPFIYMVPDKLRNVNPDSFNPELVSIGPLHREDKNVQAFERKKVGYLIDLMRRIGSPQEEILESCMEKAYALMDKIKASYNWTTTTTYDDDEIAKMMVMDACFILEFMMKFGRSNKEMIDKNVLQFSSICHDLVLLENQIPIFFLNEVFQCTLFKCMSGISLIQLINPLLDMYNLFTTDLKTNNNVSVSTTDHILSLLHQCYMPPDNIKKDLTGINISSAVDLDMAGINFNPSKDLAWAMGMEVKQHMFPNFFNFWSKPTLTMSLLMVQDFTEFLLRNLIAFEQSFYTRRYVTAYVSIMDMLINTQDDVAKLVESGILTNIMGSNKEAASMINSICKNVFFTDFYYNEELQKLNKYCNGYWPKHIVRMKRTYFSSPWNIIALVAGSILFIMQVVQTIFSIKSGLK